MGFVGYDKLNNKPLVSLRVEVSAVHHHVHYGSQHRKNANRYALKYTNVCRTVKEEGTNLFMPCVCNLSPASKYNLR